jgi:hypothetical protein
MPANIPPQPPDPISPTALYTYEQAAAHLQRTVRSLRNAVYSGAIGHVELNETTWRVQGRQLLDFIERRSRPPTR